MTMIPTGRVRIGLLLLSLCFVPAVSAQNLTVPEIMAEPSIAGMRVEGERLSPDGSKVVFLWNAEGKMPLDLYLADTSGATPPRIILRTVDVPVPSPSPTPENKLNYGLTVRDEFARARENGFGGFDWSPDSNKLLFSRGGDLYVLTLGEAKPKRYTKTQSPEFGARFVDNDRILYQQSGNIYVLNTRDATTVQLSREANQQGFINVGGATLSKDGKMLAYSVSDNSKQRALVVPNYLGEFVEAGSTRRGWSDQRVMITPTDGSRDSAIEIKLPKPEGVHNLRRMAWTSDDRSLIIDRVDKDTKRRQLFYVYHAGDKDQQLVLVSDETDPKWQAPLSSIVEPNPKDPLQLFFCSEKDGYNHIYLATIGKLAPQPNPTGEQRQENKSEPPVSTDVAVKQLTSGNWQVEWAKWTADGSKIVYESTESGPAQRQFSAVSPATGSSMNLPTNGESGMQVNPQMDDTNAQPTLIYSFSQWNRPDDIYALHVCPGCAGLNSPVQLTHTVPATFAAKLTSTPKFVDIPSRDGKQIKSRIYLPAGFSTAKKHPMVVFVHGAGYLQNVINGWNNYDREFLFNELLTQHGYVVLDMDYRGSAGYGRDWRTDVYDFLGGKDYDDELDGIDYMIKNYAVDPAKVGVYGGSYGGFMAEMMAFRAPDRIAAAAALRPVADWKNYYASSPGYTAQRLGFPDKNPEAYKRSSPISYADGLKTHLLILHGIVDDNVHVEDSMQLTEKLIRLGKTQWFDEQFYPSESHGFVRPTSWTDEYTRIFNFFERYLK